jgi:hypothetical protein
MNIRKTGWVKAGEAGWIKVSRVSFIDIEESPQGDIMTFEFEGQEYNSHVYIGFSAPA